MKYPYKTIFFLTLLIIEFLATATKGVEQITLGWDKLNHLAAFSVLYILFSLAFRQVSVVLKVVLLIAYGLQIEIAQHFLPPREFSLLDVIADMLGILFGFFIYPYAAKFAK
ncbi:MAG: VanZ family protein [Sulfurovaceae bacterium]